MNNNYAFDPSITIKGKGQLLIQKYVNLEKNVFIDLGESTKSFIQIGCRSKVKYGAVLRTYDGTITVGERSTIGEYSVIAGHGGVDIGNLVIIAGHCYIAASEHIYTGNTAVRFQGETSVGIKIGDGVWIGANSTLLDGVTIGNNTIIGAGSVVTRSLPPDFICFGAPCKPIRKK